uniref:Uncharacterized protein n=1 Tax=Euplotes harpa TaxID=151035 RepID=A0A7S3JP57_9SPIT|mmetsp:Transcript_9151/g.10319  ORF Transcript_9151/g.10319 Transcript_9151/m.10319 type:complete len:132 (+) Transcript_9151:209-604(+)
MICDPVLDFEKRRNEPARYNRFTMIKTIQAMKRIDEIKVARQQRFWKKRMEKSKDLQIRTLQKELEKHVDLIDDETVKSKILADLEEKRQKEVEKNNKNRKKVVPEVEEEQEMEVEVVKTKKKKKTKVKQD